MRVIQSVSLALKCARPRQLRAVFFVLAVLTFLFIALVARAHHLLRFFLRFYLAPGHPIPLTFILLPALDRDQGVRRAPGVAFTHEK
jgi:hypothetical protein